MVEETVSLREAHRCLKIWRAMWKVSAALGYCLRDADPSLGVRNRAAPGRSATWTEGEVARLFKRAWRDGYHGLAACIAVAWSTQMSPGDVRALRASQLARNATGAMFFTARGKTGVPVGGALSVRALTALQAYIARLAVDLHGEAYIFRNRSGAPYSSDTLGDDFRDVRRLVFGDRDARTLADFRRSGAVEAIAGDATPAALAHAMGNTLSAIRRPFGRCWRLAVVVGRGSAERVNGMGFETAKSRNATARKVATARTNPAKSLISGGSDGTRTRDLRRDRPTL